MDDPEFKSFHLVYVLELEGGCYYVGTTTNLNRRLYEHYNNMGARWTKEHKPIQIRKVCLGGRDVEKKETLKLIQLYGKQSVRGAGFTHGKIKPEPHLQLLLNPPNN